MAKPLASYQFTVLTDEERDAVMENIESESWENALLDGKMLRFDRRPRFKQMFRLTVEKSDTPVVKSLSRDGSIYLWLEAAAPEV
jgi:hypothetical protein